MYNLGMQRLRNINKRWLFVLALLALFSAIGVYNIPSVQIRVDKRVHLLESDIYDYFNPPEDEIFQPGSQNELTIETAIGTARAEILLTLTPKVKATSTPTLGPTLTPTITTTPLPGSVILPGIKYVDQHGRWNYCGPANLTMALNFWGWKGNRDDIAKVIKPGDANPNKNFIEQGFPDKNVMPYELVDFVNNNTEYRALWRYGGNIELIKKLIAAGFPVVVEKGYYERDASGVVSWLGHYLFTTGYDDKKGGFIVQDAYLIPGKDLLSKYEEYQDNWRPFNYLFIVVYPAAREGDVLSLIGEWVDQEWAAQHAFEIAESEIETLTGNDLYYAFFNKGTSLVALNRYAEASFVYDAAFDQYAKWDTKQSDRPFRMMWFQTGPYFAYFYAARYQDVINLANTTLKTLPQPTLEESLLWRGRAEYMIGDTQSAVNDYRAALKVHVNWFPAVQALQEIGYQP